MNIQISSQPATPDHTAMRRSTAVWITLLTIVLILWIYQEVAVSIVATWLSSDTYAHGFLIVPFSLYMIWQSRHQLAAVDFRQNFWPVLLLAGLGFGWVMASIASVLVVQQYALVAMIPLIVWAMLGRQLFVALIFPLAYLLFAVPFGEALIPPLIDFTADFTVSALQLTGIPVYREGSFFSIPSGNWSVVEACSGVRYLIASVTLGTLYAYLTYHSLTRRLVFIGLSIIVPIIANGLRAYMIVMIGHLSDMQLAVGVDHLIYGWIFFGLVMLLLFWIGAFWREDHLDTESTQNSAPATRQAAAVSRQGTLGMAVLVVTVAAIWPGYVTYLDAQRSQHPVPAIHITDPAGQWAPNASPLSDWMPSYVGAPTQYISHFRNEQQRVSLYITYYRNQLQGDELINSGHMLVAHKLTGWRRLNDGSKTLSLPANNFSVNQSQLHGPHNRLLIWRWYWLIDQETTSPYLAKMLLAINQILGKGDDGAEIIVVTDYDSDPREAVPVLHKFLSDMMPAISAGLHAARQADN
ncbi:exosortase A [Nitrosomonas sp. ANs5]|uniref:exosortase A n=1 Tax=Nitrosomonas sp. ANs5 TaxID=3423941 RepID=UPI003D33CE00